MENVSEIFGQYALSIIFALAIFVIGKFVARKATDIIITLMGKNERYGLKPYLIFSLA